MYITKIKLKNFKIFEKEITLDLSPNLSQIENDEKLKYFIKKDGKYMSTVNAIGGRNASGKTTFIMSMLFIKKYFNDVSTRAALNNYLDNKFKEKENKKLPPKEGQVKNLSELQKIIQEISKYEEFVENMETPDPNSSLILDHKQEVINKIYRNTSNGEEGEPIQIAIDFVYKKEIIHFVYLMNERKESHYFLNKNKRKITNKNQINEYTKLLKEIFGNLLIISSDNIGQKISRRTLKTILKKFGEDFVLNMLKVADHNIMDINISDKNEEIILKNGKLIEPKNLSSGTKKFIYYLANIIESIDKCKKGTFIFIDEIERAFHYSLVDFFKKWIRQVAKKNDIQLFFTSHDIYSLSTHISFKQTFFIVNDALTNDLKFEKVSTRLKPNNSLSKKYFEEKIGSHPSDIEMEDLLGDIYGM